MNAFRRTSYAVALCLLTFAIGGWPANAEHKLYVITSNTTLAYFVKEIGGSKVEVESLARATQDLHTVDPRPSFVTKLRDADMVVPNGLAFDIWILPLLDAARNPKVITGAKGYVDAAQGVHALEVPSGKVSMSQGELHPLGNPHYLLDPNNARIALKNILQGLNRVSPGDAAYFRTNYEAYVAQLDKKIAEWDREMAPHKGKPVVTFHKSWTYFLKAFELTEFGTIEPKPSIPPSPSHVNDLIKSMQQHGVKVIIKEPYFPAKYPEAIAKATNAQLLVVPEWVGGEKGTETYFTFMDHLVSKVANALK